MDQHVEMSVSGMDELTHSLDEVLQRFPDASEEMLKKDARVFRKDVTGRVREDVKTNPSNKKSLSRVGNYKISQVDRTVQGLEVQVKPRSPHFHLVDQGHNMVTHKTKRVNGKKVKADSRVIGHVEGRHMMSEAIKIHEDKMPKVVDDMIDELLKKEGLI